MTIMTDIIDSFQKLVHYEQNVAKKIGTQKFRFTKYNKNIERKFFDAINVNFYHNKAT